MDFKRHLQQQQQQLLQNKDFIETDLLLPISESNISCSNNSEDMTVHKRLYLPTSSSKISTDNCISMHSVFYSQAQSLIANPPLTINSMTPYESSKTTATTPIIYIHQREVGYVSSNQYNGNGAILVSDSATTCHILALRSSSTNEGKEIILGSLCHLDSPNNESCIRSMIVKHLKYHSTGDNNTESCFLEIHISGGYIDKGNQSAAITSHLLRLLSKLATDYAPIMTMRLLTCITTNLNDEAFLLGDGIKSRPVFGGMSLNVQTGQVLLLKKVDESLRGPAATLRRVRIWSSSPHVNTLLTIHHAEKEGVIIPPFRFSPIRDLDLLLLLPDDVLLKYSSTSPECEGDDFCDLTRKSFRFLKDKTAEDIFGKDVSKSIVHRWSVGEWHEEDNK